MDLTAITFTELRYLVAVADTGSFGRAAARCHVTQPTLSMQVKKLEGTLGVRLFERGPKVVRPTAAAEPIIARARAVLDEVRAIGDLARGYDAPLTGTLRLGAIPTLAPYVLPWLVPPLQRAYPRLRLVVRESVTASLVEELTLHRLDAALVALPVIGPGLVAEPLFDEPFWLIAPARHRLAARARVREDDLRGERVLLLTEGHCLRDQALAICGDAAGDDGFCATSLETLRQLVAAGLGCTLMPALALRTLAAHKTTIARAFRAPAPHRRIGIVWRRSYPGAIGVRALAQFIRDHVPRGVHAVSCEISPRTDTPTTVRERTSR